MRLLPAVLALLLLLSSSVPGGGECFGCLSIRAPPPNTCTVALGVPDGAERGFYLLGFQMCFLPIFELEFVF